jgi:hypothetical protein
MSFSFVSPNFLTETETTLRLTKDVGVDILKFLVTINGVAQLWAEHGHFLGRLSSDQYDSQSILNPHTYGSSYSYSSIQNPDSPYGGTRGRYSPYNPNCINPPVIVYKERSVLLVTRNISLQTNNLPIVDPDLMLGVYALRSMLTTQATMIQLEAAN